MCGKHNDIFNIYPMPDTFTFNIPLQPAYSLLKKCSTIFISIYEKK